MDIPKWVKWVLGLVIFVAASVATVWFSGFMFFVLSKANPIGQTDFSTWLTFWEAYNTNPVIEKRLKVSLIVAAVLCYGVPIFGLIAALREERALHGKARFATTGEVAKQGLFAEQGIIVGKMGRRFLMFEGMQFVLLAAPTRSGKGVGIVIPNLLGWMESVVVTDVKLENFLITSGYRRKHGHAVYLLNPFAITEDPDGNPLYGLSHRYNPLGYVNDDPNLRITDIISIGYSLYPGEGKDSFFDDSARNLFLGLCLYLCETPTLPRTIGELLRQSSGKGKPIKEHIQTFITERNYREYANVTLNSVGEDRDEAVALVMSLRDCDDKEADALCNEIPAVVAENVPAKKLPELEERLQELGCDYELDRFLTPLEEWDGVGLPMLSSECVDALSRFTNTSDNTASSIMATFNVPLTLWASPVVDAATSANDFDLRNVRKSLMSVYVGIPANKLAEAKVLLNMFYTQLVNLNTNQLLNSTPALKYTCLMLNDEFTAPGRIGAIDSANSFMAGYGLRLLTIVQSPGQLQRDAPRGYGKEGARTLMTNHALQIMYTPRDQTDANEYSEMLGYDTVHARGKNHGRGGTGTSEQEGEGAGQKRALMLPQELKTMPQKFQVIGMENSKPIKCQKIFYYAEPVFVDRLKLVSPTLAALGKKLPSKKLLDSVWGSGELASHVPALELDLHQAIVQNRMRDTTVEDIEGGIDLRRIAVDTSKIAVVQGDHGLAPEAVEGFVDDFFASLGVFDDEDVGADDGFDSIDDDGSSAPSSDAELDALDAAAALDDDDPMPATAASTASANQLEIELDDEAESPEPASQESSVTAEAEAAADLPAQVVEEIEEPTVDDNFDAELTDEELADLQAAMEDFDSMADDGYFPDESELIADFEELEKEYEFDEESDTAPILDLSVLDSPRGQNR